MLFSGKIARLRILTLTFVLYIAKKELCYLLLSTMWKTCFHGLSYVPLLLRLPKVSRDILRFRFFTFDHNQVLLIVVYKKAAAKPKAAIALSSDRQAIIALIIFGSGKQSVDHSKWGLNTTSTLPMLFTNTGWYRRNRRANGEVIEKENGKCSWVKNHCENDIELPYLGQ